MHQLIDRMFMTAFANPLLEQRHDAAVFAPPGGRLALTTDSYVIKPLFFPGGDIGSLAVNGTVNDLSMAGARPLYLTAGFIIEEGLLMEDLWRIVLSMKEASQSAGIRIVTGDTKVVDKGKGDGIYINTSGVGVAESGRDIGPRSVKEGDAVLINGDVGRHGMAVMAKREGIEFESEIESDCMPLWGMVECLLHKHIEIRCLRDATRGGVASTLNEIAEAAGAGILVDERQVPVRGDVHAACEMLGFDPLYVACEGRFLAFVPGDQAERALSLLRRFGQGNDPRVIGRVTRDEPGRVILKSAIGATRVLDMLSGEQLPRIC